MTLWSENSSHPPVKLLEIYGRGQLRKGRYTVAILRVETNGLGILLRESLDLYTGSNWIWEHWSAVTVWAGALSVNPYSCTPRSGTWHRVHRSRDKPVTENSRFHSDVLVRLWWVVVVWWSPSPIAYVLVICLQLYLNVIMAFYNYSSVFLLWRMQTVIRARKLQTCGAA